MWGLIVPMLHKSFDETNGGIVLSRIVSSYLDRVSMMLIDIQHAF